MIRTLRQLWDDDNAAVISIELILIIGILVFGIIPGLIALRNSTIATLATLANFANALSSTLQSGTYVAPSQVSAVQVAPVVANIEVIPPAP